MASIWFAFFSFSSWVSCFVAKITATNLPIINRVQQVSLEDYEEVKKLWIDNYKNLEPPKNSSGENQDRTSWINNDILQINTAISLLSSIDPMKNDEGIEMVANILPFLLIGGFSKSEVIGYLKASAKK